MDLLLGDNDSFSGPMKTKFLEQEITRLQELCRQNFAAIDDLKKQNGKLMDVQTELKETTSDLAYSLAECPWWKEDNVSIAIRILASYTQKVQYILGLPTFIDPVEQLEKKGRFNHHTIKRILNNKRNRNYVNAKKAKFKCLKCKKSFAVEKNFNNHKNLHKQSVRTLHCKCGETFPAFLLLRHQNQECKHRKYVNQFVNSVQNSHRNLRIRRYVKCGQCQATFVSSKSYYKHIKFCRFSTDKWSRNQPLATNGIPNGLNDSHTAKKSNVPTNQHSYPLTMPQTSMEFSNDSIDDSVIAKNQKDVGSDSEANVTEMLNCSLSNLIGRGFTITVHNRPNGSSFRKHDKNTATFSDGNVLDNGRDKSNLSLGSPLSNLSEYNGTRISLDESSKDKPKMYECNLCEFRTDVRHFLVSHSTSQCRWRHFMADQIPFLKTLHKMSFEERNSSKDSSETNPITDLQNNEGLVINVNTRCRQRASTL